MKQETSDSNENVPDDNEIVLQDLYEQGLLQPEDL